MEEKKKICPHCGKEIRANAIFCVECGRRLEPIPEPPKPDLKPSKPPKNSKKIFLAVGIIGALAVGIGAGIYLSKKNPPGPGVDQNSYGTTSVEPSTTSASTDSKKAVDVNFQNFYKNSKEYAILTGKDENGEELWTVKTESHAAAELDSCVPIGIYNDGYYYIEAGDVIKLDLEEGKEIWRCTEISVGSPAEKAMAFGEDGMLYLSGWYGPDFVAIDKDGILRHVIVSFSENEEYFWPYKMDYKQSYIDIYFEGNNAEESEDTIVHLNLDDYSYSATRGGKTINVKGNGSNATTATATNTKSSNEITLEGVDANNKPDYNNCTSPSNYKKVVIKEGEFSFGYPENFFNKVEKEGDNYTFTSEGAVATLCVKHEKGSGDKVYDVQNAYKFLEGKIDIEDERYAQKRVADKEKDGWTRCIYTGLYIDDPNKSVYFIGASNGEDVYTLEFEYFDSDVDDFYTPEDYMVDCLYRLCDHSGADYEIRTYEQFLRDDSGTKK